MSERNNFTRKNSDSYNIGNAPNIYGDTSYYYSQTDSFILVIPPQIILTLFSGDW